MESLESKPFGPTPRATQEEQVHRPMEVEIEFKLFGRFPLA